MVISGPVKRKRNNSIESRTLNSTLYGFLQMVLTFVSSILLVPLLITNWGTEKYGMYLNIFAFIQLLKTLDLGHQVFVGNEFNREFHSDRFKARIILASSFRMALVLGFIEVLIFLGLWWSGKTYSLLGIPPGESTPIMLGILCMVIMWWMVGSISGVLIKAVLSKGLFAQTVLWGILLKVLEIILLVFAGLGNLSLFHFLWLWAGINFIYSLMVVRWIWIHLGDIGFNRKLGGWKESWLNFRNSTVITVNYGFEQVAVSGINFLITRYLTLALLPVYTTIRTITNTAVQLTGLFTNPLQPELLRYHGERAGEKIKNVIKTYWVINGFLVNFALIAILPFIEWLYNVWTNDLLVFDIRLFGMLCLSVSIFNYGRTLTTYLNGINDLKSMTWMSVSRSVITLGIIFLFIKQYGLVVIGVAVFLAEIVSSLVIPAFRTKKVMRDLNTKLDWSDMFLTFIPFLILAFAYIGNIWFDLNIWLMTFVGMACMIVVYSLAWTQLEPAVQDRLKSLALRFVGLNRRA